MILALTVKRSIQPVETLPNSSDTSSRCENFTRWRNAPAPLSRVDGIDSELHAGELYVDGKHGRRFRQANQANAFAGGNIGARTTPARRI